MKLKCRLGRHNYELKTINTDGWTTWTCIDCDKFWEYWHSEFMNQSYSVSLISLCSDADTDKCPPNDPNCMWRTHTCHFCGEDYKISKRGLTGKYMIGDHLKICKEYK